MEPQAFEGNRMRRATTTLDSPSRPEPPNPKLYEPLLRPQDAARLLSVRPSWVYEAVRERRLPCVRVGRHIRFTRSMLEQWMSEHTDA